MSTNLMNVNEAAERIGMSPRFVRRLAYERRLAHFKVGTALRFDTADLDAWISQCRVERIR